MANNNKKLKGVIGFLTVASIASTAATIYVLLEDNKKANNIRRELAELVNALKDWEKSNLENKNYANELDSTTLKQIKKYEEVLTNDKIKDYKVLEQLLNEAKNDFESDKQIYSSLEKANTETLDSLNKFNTLLDKFATDNANNDYALDWINRFKESKKSFENEYKNTKNESTLLDLKSKIDASLEQLKSVFDLSAAIARAESINSKLPANFKNKENYESAIQEAKNVLNSADSTNEQLEEAAKKLEQYNNHFESELSKEKQLTINEIKALLDDAEKYKNTTLDTEQYNLLSSKLNEQIRELKNKLEQDNDLSELESMLEKANTLKPEASLVKEAIDQVLEKLPSAENVLLEINSSPKTFEASNIKNKLEDSMNKAKNSLTTLNADKIKNTLISLDSNINYANYLIKKAKDDTIAETQTLIEKAKEESAKLENQEEYEDKKELLDDTIAKVEKQNNEKTIIGDLIKNKEELEKTLSDTRKSVARDNLLKAINEAEKNLNFIKDNNVISPYDEFETFINEAKQVLNSADVENKSVDDIVNDYNNAANTLTAKFLEKAKLATEQKIQSSEELSRELAKEAYLINGKESGAKKDLDARIQSATVIKDSQDSTSNDVITELHKLNLAYNEAKRFKDADDDQRNEIIREIESIKAELKTKSDELSGEKDNLSNQNNEKYKPLIDELTKILDNYENKVKPEVEDYGIARLNEVKKQLEDALNSVPEKKSEIDTEFEDLSNKLNEALSKANELLSQMATDEYNPEKQNLIDLINKAKDESNKDTIDELKALIKDFSSANKAAETKIQDVNEEKTAEIEKINNLVNEINTFISANRDEYPEIVKKLEDALALVKNDNQPTLANTLEEIKNKFSNLNNAFEEAKTKVQDEQNKDELSLSITKLEVLKEKITSNDPSMTDLKANLEQQINDAKAVINNEETSKYVSEKNKLDTSYENARQEIQTFEEKLADLKEKFKQALANANNVLESAKTDENTANYGGQDGLISKIETKIANNNSIDDNDPLASIQAKIDALNNVETFYNEEKAKIDAQTNQALTDLMTTINSATNIKNSMIDPAISEAKNTLNEAIAQAQEAHDKTPKLTIQEINLANSQLQSEIQKANQAIADLNNKKQQLKDQINEKATEIENYINNDLNNPEYDNIKTNLETYLNNFKNTEANRLDEKTKAQLETLLNQMQTHLDSAKEQKNEKDREINERNKQALIASKEAIENIANGLTNQATEIVDLKKQLTDAITETNRILDNNITSSYVSQKEALDNLNTEATAKVEDFNRRWNAANTAFNQALQAANAKLNELKQNPTKYATAINNLQSIINQNNTSNNNIDISAIEAKTTALINSVTYANIDKEKADAKAIVDTLGNLSSTRKDEIKSDIDGVSNMQPYADAVAQIKEKVLAARKENYSTFINNIPYPNPTSQNTMQNKADIINRLVNPINEQTTQAELNTLESTLNELKTKVENAASAISALPDGSVKNAFNTSLESANENNIDALKAKIDKYSQILAKINAIPFVTNTRNDSQEAVNSANAEITKLKDALKAKLATASEDQLDDLSALVSKDSQTVSHIISTFVGDIAISNNLIKELTKKTTTADAQKVYDVVTPIYNELREFWNNANKGPFIRNNQNNYPSSATGALKPYNDFINNVVRQVTTAEAMKNINDNIVPLYHAGVDFNNKIKAIGDDKMPQNVKDALKTKLLSQTDLAGMNNVIKYVAQPVGNPIDTGWYLDAYNQLASIGTDANKAPLLAELKNVNNAPTDDVLNNIKLVRDKIIAFKDAYDQAHAQLREYALNPEKIQSEYDNFAARLATVTTKEQADALKTDIQNAITVANNKRDLKEIVKSINYPGGIRAAGREELLNNINSITLSTNVEEMKTNLNALKLAMDRARTELPELPYPIGGEAARNSIRADLNNATTASDVNTILPSTWSSDITSYKTMINSLPANKQGGLNTRLTETYPTSTNNDSSISELKKQIIATHKAVAIQEIRDIDGLDENSKNRYISSINSILENGSDTIEQMNEKIGNIREQVRLANAARLQLARNQAQAEIEKLPSGNTVRNELSTDMNSASTVAAYDTIKTNAIEAKKELDAAKQKAQTAIDKLPDSVQLKSTLKEEMKTAINKADYESIEQRAKQEEVTIRENIKNGVKQKLLNESFVPQGSTERKLNWVDERYIEWFNQQLENATLQQAIDLERQFAATKFFEKVRLNNIMKWLRNKVSGLSSSDNFPFMDMISKFQQYPRVENLKYHRNNGIPYTDRNGNSRSADDLAVLYTQAIPFSNDWAMVQNFFNTIFQWQSVFNGTPNIYYGYFKNNNTNSIIDKSIKLLRNDLSNEKLSLDKIYEYSKLIAGLGDPSNISTYINNLKSAVPYARTAMAEDSTYYFDRNGNKLLTKTLLP